MRRIALVIVLAAAPATADDHWPQWRGPDGLGVSAATGFPTEWAPDRNVAWKTEIPGRGHSSPAVWDDRIFLTTSIEGAIVQGNKAPVHLGFDRKPGYVHPDSVGADRANALKVIAVDARSGKILWERTAYDGAMYDDRHRKNTYASSTIATDGRRLYAFFESAGLFCYDVDGHLKWKVSFGGLAKAGLGPGSSPVLFENLVIVQCDLEMGEGSFIAALDRQTGKEVWRTLRAHRRSWATPLVVHATGRTELVASGAESIIAYDPKTGRELWRAEGVVSHPIPSAVAGQGLVVVTAGSQQKRAIAIRPGGSGDLGTTDAIAWRYTKGTAYVPSPILYGEYVYLMTDKGLLTCLDVKTGALQYEGGRVPVPATFTASPVAFDGMILLTSEDGETFVIRAGPKHEMIRTNSVGEPVFASPALANKTIFIRGERHLFAIRGGTT
ncbi:MAG: PQQ-binding-like beta-propeller repeat protein [Vicinamibacterales bacterium]